MEDQKMRRINNVSRFIDKGSDSFKALLKLASKQSQLKAEEQTRLVMLYQRFPNTEAGKAARDMLVQSNILFVVKLAKDYVYKTDLPLEDLVSEGFLGLMTAIERYRIQEEASFLGYASWWIRQHIQLLIEKAGETVRLPQNQLQLIAKIEKARRQFVQVNYYEPTLYDLADLTGETDEHVREAMIAMGGRVSLDKPINDKEDDSESIGQLFSDDYYANDAELFEESRAIEIKEALKNMFCERDQEIMKHYYGLFGYEPKTIIQLSEITGLSDERVRQIVKTCTRQLRKAEALSDYQCA